MGRLALNGFETRDMPANGNTADGGHSDQVADANWLIQQAVTRNGGSALAVLGAASGANRRYGLFGGGWSAANPNWAAGVLMLRVYFLKTANPANVATIIDNATTNSWRLNLGTDGKLSTWMSPSGPTLATAANALNNNQWYRIEISVDSVTRNYTVYVDGVAVLAGTFSTGDLRNGASVGNIGGVILGAGCNLYFDDAALNDTSVPAGFVAGQLGAQDGLPGDGSIRLLKPVADLARGANWLAGAGGTANLFDALDNLPPVGLSIGTALDTSEIKNTNATVTENYDATLQSYNAAGVPLSEGIMLIHPLAATGYGFDAATLSAALRLLSNPAEAAEKTFIAGAPTGPPATHPIGWALGRVGNMLYLPDSPVGAIARGGQPQLRLGKRAAGTLQAEMLALQVETSIRIAVPGGDLAMLL